MGTNRLCAGRPYPKMRWTIDNSTLPAYICVKVDGPFNTHAVALMCSSILTNEDFEPGIPMLLDNRKIDVENDHHSASDMISRALSAFEDLSGSIPSSCIAVLMDADKGFVEARQLQYALLLKDLPGNIEIFFAEDKAVKWIGLCGSR